MKSPVSQDVLDFLRGLAAFYVLINHTRGAFFVGGRQLLTDDPSILDYAAVAMLQATSLGAEFVILFFALSGFAMAHSVRHSASTGSFYLKRLVRIWPPYLAATAFAFAVGKLVGAEDIQERALQVAVYVNVETSVTPQFWSLPYEVLFYILCPFILATRRRVDALLGVAAVLCAVTVVIFGVKLNPSPSLLIDFFGNELAFFACGAIAYHYFERVPKMAPGRFALVALLLLAVAWASKSVTDYINIFSSGAMVCLAVIAMRNLPEQLARVRWLNLGFFSYSIYLFNYALLVVVVWFCRSTLGIDPASISNPLAWVAVVPPVLAGCYLLYLVAERPSNSLLSSYRRARQKSAIHAADPRMSE